ncbi:MAG TPA: ABC transporter permease, partial [Vicinamibacterales bacterium]|nr:ABC transporter permease [Vicinamibacterales bacterium]
PGDTPRAILRGVSPGYFETLGIPIVRGRSLTDTDADGAERVAVVNEALADQVFPGEEAVGRLIDLLPGARAPWTRRPGPVRIVGVAANTKDIGINEVAFGNLTMPFAQMPSTSLELVAKLEGTAADVAEELRAVAGNVDPQVPVAPVSFLSRRVETALQGDRFNLFAIVLFAGLALVVAAVGIYGSASYAADARRREFGVRLAIGATPGRLTREALTDAGRLGAVGAIIGLGGVLVTARLLGNALYLVPGSHVGLLYGVETTDPLVLGAASISAVLVAVAAAAQPAMRVGRVDPLQALRSE